MNFRSDERVAVFIDGSSLFSASRSLGFDVDYRKMRKFFEEKSNLRRIYYYAAILESQDYSPLKPLTDWLVYNGYMLVTKPAKEYTDSAGRRRVKSNMEMEIAIDMLDMAPSVDRMVLFSGDADFRCLVEAVQRKGVRVSVVSSIKTPISMVADELRRQADEFIELSDISVNFTRERSERPMRQEERDIDLPSSLVGPPMGEAEVIDDRRNGLRVRRA